MKHDLIPLLLQYLLPRIGRYAKVEHGLQLITLKQCWPLQQIRRLCRDYRSICKSIKHCVSAMKQLNYYPNKIRSPLTSSAFVYSHCSYLQNLGLVEKEARLVKNENSVKQAVKEFSIYFSEKTT